MAKGQAISVYKTVDLLLVPGAMVLQQQASGAATHQAVILESGLFVMFVKVATHHTKPLGFWACFPAAK